MRLTRLVHWFAFVLVLGLIGLSPAVGMASHRPVSDDAAVANAPVAQGSTDPDCFYRDPAVQGPCEYEDGVAPEEGIPQAVPVGAKGSTSVSKATLTRPAAVPGLFRNVNVNGGYVAAGVGLRNLGYGTINISGIPTGASVLNAYLYWSIFNPTNLPTMDNGRLNGTLFTGVLVGSGQDANWGATNGYAYRADVTTVVRAKAGGPNGAYALTQIASGRTDGADPSDSQTLAPLAEGASLVIIFSKAGYPLTRVQIYNGYQYIGTEAGETLNASWGFAASNPTPEVRTTFIGADGQSNFTEPASTFNGTAISRADWDGTDPQNVPSYSIGNLWDTDTASVGRFIAPGATGAPIVVKGSPDALIWVAQVLSIGLNGAADSDGDALLDGWEANGIAAFNLPFYGASVVRKDIFVEMDYMGAEAVCPCHLPLAPDLDRIRAVFAAAPYANNPNGQVGINIHLDAGAARGAFYNLGGGNLVPHDNDLNPVNTEFNALKTTHFNAARAPIFHYMIWAHGYSGGSSSGLSFGIPADSFIVTLGLWGGHGSSNEKVGTFIHELGHNLGLGHGGNEGKNYKPNYLSVMTYAFQTIGVLRTGTIAPYFGYSVYDLPDLNENALNETVGLNSVLANTYRTRWFCPNGTLTTSPGTANGPLDWNCNGAFTNPVARDINGDGVLNVLTGWSDWQNIVYSGGNVGPGMDGPQKVTADKMPKELTYEESLHNHR